jgi:3-methylfumaryl-CoA hydratase
MNKDELRNWIGRSERSEDFLDPRRCAQLSAALGDKDALSAGDPMPLPWHWIFFTPVVAARATGEDGHPARGGFLPPVPLPRRMWAGGRVVVQQPLILGERAVRESRIASIEEKRGKQGRLVFVTVEHDYLNESGEIALREEQDLVYREPLAGPAPPPPVHQTATPGQWCEDVVPDPVLLFRYSALTYNSHRIHYDRNWAVQQEGYPGLVVQGPLVATLLLDLLYRNGPRCRVTEFSFRAVNPLYELAPFHLCGAMVEQGSQLWALTPEKRLAMSMSCKVAVE